jgi:hypothetical protein
MPLAAPEARLLASVVDAEDALRQAIMALQADELEQAALLLPAVESFVQGLVRGRDRAKDARIVGLRALWREASAAAAASQRRLGERLNKKVASQRAVRAYGSR